MKVLIRVVPSRHRVERGSPLTSFEYYRAKWIEWSPLVRPDKVLGVFGAKSSSHREIWMVWVVLVKRGVLCGK